MERLHALVELLSDAPKDFQQQAAVALLEVVSEYEDWRSCGSPDMARYRLIKFARHKFKTPLTFQETIKKYLKDTE